MKMNWTEKVQIGFYIFAGSHLQQTSPGSTHSVSSRGSPRSLYWTPLSWQARRISGSCLWTLFTRMHLQSTQNLVKHTTWSDRWKVVRKVSRASNGTRIPSNRSESSTCKPVLCWGCQDTSAPWTSPAVLQPTSQQTPRPYAIPVSPPFSQAFSGRTPRMQFLSSYFTCAS